MSTTEDKQTVARTSQRGSKAALAGLLAKYAVNPKQDWRLAPDGLNDDTNSRRPTG